MIDNNLFYLLTQNSQHQILKSLWMCAVLKQVFAVKRVWKTSFLQKSFDVNCSFSNDNNYFDSTTKPTYRVS